MKTNKTLRYSIVLSVAIHIVIAIVLYFQNNDVLSRLAEQKKPVEVELLDAEKFLEAAKKAQAIPVPKGQVVQQEQQINDEIDEKTRFLSKHNQKVVQQTQAALNGQFKNTDNTLGEKKTEKAQAKNQEPQPALS